MEELLRGGLKELGLSGDAVPAMAEYARLLLARNRVQNLTAITDEAEVVRLHFLDSAALLGLYDFTGKSVVDVGTGPGFPGLVLRLAEPSIRLTLLDAQKKRVDFLDDVCTALGLNDVSRVCARAEEITSERREVFSVAVSRAVAPLPMLAELCLPLVEPDGAFLAMKSVNASEELRSAGKALSLLGGKVEHIADYTIPGTDVRHRLIVIRKVRRTPPGYPRPFAKIKRRPL